MKKQQPVRLIILNYKKDGTPFWNLLHINPIHDEHGQLVSYVGVQMDVSEMAADRQPSSHANPVEVADTYNNSQAAQSNLAFK